MFKLGVSLGGGGARGAAHVGVLQHFEKIGLPIFALAGTSAGAIIASLHAFGVPTDKIASEIMSLNPTSLSSVRWGELGLMENTAVRELLVKNLGEKTDIRDSKIPLGIHVTDLELGVGVDLFHGSVVDAVLASCTVPGLYIPHKIEGRIYIDGGLTENVPFRALKALGARALIGVNLNGQDSYANPQSALDVLLTAMDIGIDSQTRRQLQNFDLVLDLDLTRFARTSAKDHDGLVQAGFDKALSQFPSIGSIRQQIRTGRFEKIAKLVTPLKLPKILTSKKD